MNYLLDTHGFVWFIEGNPRLSGQARLAIEDITNNIFLSVGSLWEMAIKVSIGKLQLNQPFEIVVPQQLRLNDIALLDITVRHTVALTKLPFHHHDPFDRLIIAQAFVEQMPIISIDGKFDAYGVQRLW